MFKFLEKADSKVQNDVTNELKWDPSVTSSNIVVTAKDGIVSLKGTVPHFFEKATAERAAQRVGGVRAVADELEVDLLAHTARKDEDIALAAVQALEWNYEVPEGVKITVEKGWVSLRGEAEWNYQRTAATKAISSLMGVCGVSNDMSIKNSVSKMDVKSNIEDALKRSAENEGRNIQIDVDGNKVTLSGNVHAFSEIEDARFAAWMTPGVSSVTNNLQLSVY